MQNEESTEILKEAFQSKEEIDVGIECYISAGGPIPAVSKYLLTDFIVNEISVEGEVLTLEKKPDLSACNQPTLEEKPSYSMNPELENEICEIIGKEASLAIV